MTHYTRRLRKHRTALGRQLLIDFLGCDPRSIGEVARVKRTMLAAARATRSTILKSVFQPFKPQGASGVVVIAESHLSVHAWPEHGLASVDIFTSGSKARPWLALPVLKRGFGAKEARARELERGLTGGPLKRRKGGI